MVYHYSLRRRGKRSWETKLMWSNASQNVSKYDGKYAEYLPKQDKKKETKLHHSQIIGKQK